MGWRRPSRDFWVSLAVLLAWNLVLYHRVLFLGEVPDGGDQNYLHYPWKSFLLRSIQEGVFPFWNPYPFCGTPFFHDIQTCTLYPPDWIYFLVPLPWGFGLSYCLHNLAAGLFFYALAGRFLQQPKARLLAALIYSGAGAFVTRLYLGNAVVIASYTWAPLFFLLGAWLFEKPSSRRVGAFALVSSLFVLAGHPQVPFLVVHLLGAFLLFETVRGSRLGRTAGEIARGWLAVFGGGLLGLGITAVQVGPFLQLAGFSATRAGGATYGFAAEGSLPVSHLVSLFMPFFLGDPTNETYWGSLIPFPETCGHLGTVTPFLILAALVFSRREATVSFWALVLGVSLLLSLGEFSPVHRLFYTLVPGWNLFRQPGRALFLLTIAGSLLAGYGLQRIERHALGRKSKELPFLGGAVACSILLLVTGLGYLGANRDRILEQFAQAQNLSTTRLSGILHGSFVAENFSHRYEGMQGALLNATIVLIVFCGLILAWRMVPRRRETIGWVLILLVALDLYRFGHRFLVTMPKAEWVDRRHPESALALQLAENSEEGRLLQPDSALDYRFRERHPELYPNGPMAQGIRTVRGYSATILAPYSRFINTLQGRPEGELPGGLLILDRVDAADPLGLAVMNVRRMIDYVPHEGPFKVVDRRPEALSSHR